MQKSEGLGEGRLVLYTDDPVLELGAVKVLSAVPHLRVFSAGPVLSSLISFVERIQPSVILLDTSPEMTVGFISILRKAVPNVRLILWARSFSETVRYQAGEIGVRDFLERTGSVEEFSSRLIDAIGGRTVSADRRPDHSKTVALTRRESQLVTLLAQGLKNKEIASCIGISEGTVRIYLSKLFAKIGARDRFEVAVFGLKNAWCGQASWDGRDEFVTEGDEDRARPVLRSLVLVEPERRRGYASSAAAASH